MRTQAQYVPCRGGDVPYDIEFQPRNPHQLLEVAYGAPLFMATRARKDGATIRHDRGAPYRRVIDRSLDLNDPRRVRFFKLLGSG